MGYSVLLATLRCSSGATRAARPISWAARCGHTAGVGRRHYDLGPLTDGSHSSRWRASTGMALPALGGGCGRRAPRHEGVTVRR